MKSISVALCLMSFVLVLKSSDALSAVYTPEVGSAQWSFQSGSTFFSDSYDGPAGTLLTEPPYTVIEHPPVALTGNSTVALTFDSDTMEHYDIGFHGISISDGYLITNFQTGPPPMGFGYSQLMGNYDMMTDFVDLGVASTVISGSPTTGLYFIDESGWSIVPLADLGIAGYTSLALKFDIDASGNVMPYYWVNAPNNTLNPSDTNWTSFGSFTTQLNTTATEYQALYTVSGTDPVAPEPDLTVRSVSKPPKRKKRGKKFTVKLKNYNKGDGTAKSSKSYVYLSKNKRYDRKDKKIGYAKVPGLNGGNTSKWCKAKVKVPKKTKPGKYYIIACADSRKRIEESDESNNCKVAKRRIKVSK